MFSVFLFSCMYVFPSSSITSQHGKEEIGPATSSALVCGFQLRYDDVIAGQLTTSGISSQFPLSEVTIHVI